MSKPSRSEIEAILAGTKGVSAGPWRWDDGNLRAGNHDYIIWPQNVMGGDARKTWADFLGACGEHSEDAAEVNAAHIARLDPQTVSALCTALLESMDRVEAQDRTLAEIDTRLEILMEAHDPAGAPGGLAEMSGDQAMRRVLEFTKAAGVAIGFVQSLARKSLGGSNER